MFKIKNSEIIAIEIEIFILGFLFYLLLVGYIFELFSLSIPYLLLNLLCFSFLYFFVLLLCGRTEATLPVSGFIAFLIHYADTCVYAARLTHIRITDFSAVTQAMRVASHYQLIWTGTQWKQVSLVVGLSVLLIIIKKLAHLKSSPFKLRLSCAAVLVLLSIILAEGTLFHVLPIPEKFSGFNANANVMEAGLIGCWYSQIVKRKSGKPDGYSLEMASAILAEYQDDRMDEHDEPVNIIVVMNESFTDYSLLGEIKFDDPLPNIHKMVGSGQIFEGKLAASVLGGGTCNTEYEFLTGNSMTFLPDGVYAFMVYVTQDYDSIATELEPLGYHTGFFHPYYSQEWNREAVYSFFGFDSFMAGDTLEGGLKNKDSIENITQSVSKNDDAVTLIFGEGLEYTRAFISDSQAYKLLIDMLSLDDSKTNDFMFCVTIQNHGGYEYKGTDFNCVEYVTGDNKYTYLLEVANSQSSSRPSIVNQYLTLSNMSDSAFQELIDALSHVNEKTILVMFGDHQPGINVDDYMEYRPDVHTDVREEKYVVPYLVWANYDLDYDFPEYISANYLSAIIKDSVNLPLNAWDRFRLHVMESYPVMTTNFVLDADYNIVNLDSSELLKEYESVQYMRMFDK